MVDYKYMKRLLPILLLVAATVLGDGVPFDATRGLVEIEVTINNLVDGRFGIDTGADRVYIDRNFAVEHGLVDDTGPAKWKIAGVGGETAGRNLIIRSLEIGGECVYNVNATVVDLAAVSGAEGDPPDGLIGHQVLERMYVTVDYPNRRLALSTNRPGDLGGGRTIAVPFDEAGHLVVVDVDFPDGSSHPMLLDYCAGVSWISRKLARAMDLDDESSDVQYVPEMSIAGAITTTDVAVVVDNLARYRRAVGGVDFEGILGAVSYTHLRAHET